jgi:hypothetical protein
MKLKCIRDVVMTKDARVAFKAGGVYDFSLNAHGEIYQKTETGVHMFRASGPDAWNVYFKYEVLS